MEIRSPRTTEATSRRSDSIAGSPAAIVIAIGFIESHAIANADCAIIATTGHATGDGCQHEPDHCAHCPTLH
jgi:hypothetical protein